MADLLIGAGFRPELPGLYGGEAEPVVDVAELIADRFFGADGFAGAWELEHLAEQGVPVALHGLSGNVASVTGPREDYLDQIARLAAATSALCYTDHLAMTEAGGHALGHLAPNRFDDELLEHAAANIARISSRTGLRVRLENLATSTTIAGSTYTPEEFYRELLSASDQWDLLLDLTNIWINAQNRPLDPVAFIDSLPAERIKYVHLAGGELHHGEWIDSHSHAVHDEVFDLLTHLLRRAQPEVIIVERDQNWDGAQDEIIADLSRVRAIAASSRPVPASRTA
jgi:uncharacterized protein (UPF0276 family)